MDVEGWEKSKISTGDGELTYLVLVKPADLDFTDVPVTSCPRDPIPGRQINKRIQAYRHSFAF